MRHLRKVQSKFVSILVLGSMEMCNFRATSTKSRQAVSQEMSTSIFVKLCDFSSAKSIAPTSDVDSTFGSMYSGTSASGRHSLLELNELTFSSAFRAKHPMYDVAWEIRLLGAYLRTYMTKLPFLRTDNTVYTMRLEAINSRNQKAYTTGDFINRFHNLCTNLAKEAPMPLKIVKEHIFFHNRQQTYDFIRFVVDHGQKPFRDEMCKVENLRYVLGGRYSWLDRMCSTLKLYVRKQQRLAAERDLRGAAGGQSHTMSTVYNYDNENIFDLLKLYRNIGTHQKDLIIRGDDAVVRVIGDVPEELIQHMTLTFPALVTVTWVAACKIGILKLGHKEMEHNPLYKEVTSERRLPALPVPVKVN